MSQTPEAPAKEDVNVAAWNVDVERILSNPLRGKGQKFRRKKPPDRPTTQVELLVIIKIGTNSAIIGLRYLSEAFGVSWIDE